MKRLFTLCLFSLLPALAGRDGQLSANVSVHQGACQPEGGAAASMNRATHGWTNIGPGSPGVVAPIAPDPQGSGTVYVASVGGGVRKSIDNGATWSTVSSGLSATAFYSLAMDASGPQTVYAGAFGGGGLFKSTDGGLNWMGLGPVGGIPVSLAADPHTPGVVFMGFLGGTIRRSANGGITWQTLSSASPPSTPSNTSASIVVDPLAANVVYAATLGGLVKLTSIDGG
jgi:hypothetical protein